MARKRSSSPVGTRTSASASLFHCTKRSSRKHSALASSLSLYPLVALIQLLRTDHVTLDPERAQLPLQRKTNPARFIDRVHFGSTLLKLGCPAQQRLLLETLRWLRITPSFLHHHDVKILVHINPKLDVGFATIKLAAGFLE